MGGFVPDGMKCGSCGSSNMRRLSHWGNKTWYKCNDCGWDDRSI